MRIIHSIAELRQYLARESNIGLVPTMGNLHDGHLSLVELARQQTDCVVVSIFVNPLQFAAGEDFSQYPRSLAQDCARLEDIGGVTAVFAPSESEMYPNPASMLIQPPDMAHTLCGKVRPHHFSGVLTVVLKLFNLVGAHLAVFGQKDYQQVCLIKDMVAQFNLPVRILIGDTVREASGLALSSRNQYLSSSR